jgi:beta-lactamase regulating signal transducer with metallopeptidase domain
MYSAALLPVFRAILTMSISGGIVALLLFALKPLLRNRLPKSAQYYMWLVFLAALVIPFSAFVKLPPSVADTGATPAPIAAVNTTVQRYFVTMQDELDRANAINAHNPGAAESNTAVSAPVAVSPVWWQIARDWLLGLYPLGVIAFLLVNFLGYYSFAAKLKRHNIPAPELDCKLPVYRNALAPTPMLIGLRRPAIILPDRDYTPSQLENILRHELTHHRRRDVAVKWLSVLAGAIHWFNPIVYFARRELDRACELSCDEAVIAALDVSGKREYGETLISVVAVSRMPAGVLSTTMCEEKKALKERLGAIMKSKKHTRRTVIVSAALLLAVAAGAILIGSSSSGAAADTPPTPPPTSQPVPTPTPAQDNAPQDVTRLGEAQSLAQGYIDALAEGVDLAGDEDAIAAFDVFFDRSRLGIRNMREAELMPDTYVCQIYMDLETPGDAAYVSLYVSFQNDTPRLLCPYARYYAQSRRALDTYLELLRDGDVSSLAQFLEIDGDGSLTTETAKTRLEFYRPYDLSNTKIASYGYDDETRQFVALVIDSVGWVFEVRLNCGDGLVSPADPLGFDYDNRYVAELENAIAEFKSTGGALGELEKRFLLSPVVFADILIGHDATTRDDIAAGIAGVAAYGSEGETSRFRLALNELESAAAIPVNHADGVARVALFKSIDAAFDKAAAVRRAEELPEVTPYPEFSKAEVAAARAVVEEYYRAMAAHDDGAYWATWRGGRPKNAAPMSKDVGITLNDIRYDAQDVMRGSYVTSGSGSINGTDISNVIVFKCDFTTSLLNGADSAALGAWNLGKYSDWSVILTRDAPGAPWLVADNGY